MRWQHVLRMFGRNLPNVWSGYQLEKHTSPSLVAGLAVKDAALIELNDRLQRAVARNRLETEHQWASSTARPSDLEQIDQFYQLVDDLKSRNPWQTLEKIGLPEDRELRERIERTAPFGDILIYVTLSAVRSLRDSIGYTRFDSARWSKSLEYLLTRLTKISAPALYTEFSLARLSQRSANQAFTYSEFKTSVLSSEGILSIIETYPMLWRYMTVVKSNWVNAIAEICGKFGSDRRLLVPLTGCSDTTQIWEISPGYSDPHSAGRSVAIVTLTSGERLVYKPRSLRLEGLFGNFIKLIYDEAADGLRRFWTLDRGRYGWCEFVSHFETTDPDALRSYYFKLGELLCAAHFFDATDLHAENVIASESGPVAVDLECLLSPANPYDPPFRGAALAQLRQTVLRTGLLPTWLLGDAGRAAIDISGIGGWDGQIYPRKELAWKCVNTDEMYVTREYMPRAPASNLPYSAQRKEDLSQFIGAVLAGFSEMHEKIAHGLDSSSFGHIVEKICASDRRYIHRNTSTYVRLLESLCEPEHLTSGEATEKHLRSIISSSSLVVNDPRISFNEVAALLRRDVPLFHIGGATRSLLAEGREIAPEFFSTEEQATYKNRKWDGIELDLQLALINAAMSSQGNIHSSSVGSKAAPRKQLLITQTEMLDEAVAIGDQLLQAAITAKDGKLSWFGLSPVSSLGAVNIQVCGPTLYSGEGGIALLFALLGKISGEVRFTQAAHRALQELLQVRELTDNTTLLGECGIGGFFGAGSIIYTLAKVGEILREEEYVRAALQCLKAIDDETVGKDNVLDVVGGAAGLGLAALSLFGVSGDVQALRTAKVCGERLLETRSEGTHGYRIWRTLGSRHGSGFAHGAAGIAHFLRKLGAVTGERRYSHAAIEAIRYEASLYDGSVGQWDEGANNGDPNGAGLCSWCHGAPGIGFASISMSPLLGHEGRKLIEKAALSTVTFDRSRQTVDHLCCGRCGRALFVAMAAKALGNDAYMAEAGNILMDVIANGKQDGYRLTSLPRLVPGLMQGLSGVGYAMLVYCKGLDPDFITLD